MVLLILFDFFCFDELLNTGLNLCLLLIGGGL